MKLEKLTPEQEFIQQVEYDPYDDIIRQVKD